MRNFLIGATLLLASGWLFRAYLQAEREIDRLEENLYTLDQTLEHTTDRLGEEIASRDALRLRCAEFERLRAADAATIRQLGIRLQRAEAISRTETATAVEVRAPLRDTVRLYDTLRLFRWQDPWVRIEGQIARDSIHCHIESVDTLLQVVHRIPHRFLFFRWGTKALRQEILSKNPHTRVVYAEYIALERDKR